jgi:hypothetical protein
MKKLPLSVIAASAALFASNQAQAVTIVVDDFSFPQVLAPIPNTDPAGSVASGASGISGTILGGSREVVLTKTSAASAQVSDTLQASVGGGLLGVNGGNSVAHSLSLLWDGSGEASVVGVNDFGLTGVDVIDQVNGGNLANTFFSFIADVDLALSTTVTITIYKDAANFSTYTSGFLVGGGLPTQYDIALSSFVATGTGANFDDIKAIKFFESSVRGGTDINIDILDFTYTPVPEVSTAVSAGAFALLGGLVLLRSRKVAKA